MAASLARDPSIQAGLLQGHVERSIFWKDRKTGVWLKCRPDVIPISDGIAGDIKTTTDASLDKIQRAVQSWGYDAQGALVGEAFRQVLGFEMTDFVLVWIEGDEPWAVNVSPVDPEWISYGARRNRRAIDKFAKCIETGEWPAYPSEITTSMPDWLRILHSCFGSTSGGIPGGFGSGAIGVFPGGGGTNGISSGGVVAGGHVGRGFSSGGGDIGGGGGAGFSGVGTSGFGFCGSGIGFFLTASRTCRPRRRPR